MKTRLISIDPAAAEAPQAAEIISVLTAGGVMVYPTETFYGLGAAGFSAKAVGRVYELKGRDRGKPLSLVAADIDMVRAITAALPDALWPLAGKFWPGPLTLVLRAAAGLPRFLIGPGGSVAVRIPPLPWLRRVVYELSQPLTATSANLSGEGEISEPAKAKALFEGKVELIVDGGPTPGGEPTTIVDLLGPEPRVLRDGAIPSEVILDAFED